MRRKAKCATSPFCVFLCTLQHQYISESELSTDKVCTFGTYISRMRAGWGKQKHMCAGIDAVEVEREQSRERESRAEQRAESREEDRLIA